MDQAGGVLPCHYCRPLRASATPNGYLVPASGGLALLSLSTPAAPAQSRRLLGLWQQLARHPTPDAKRERLLWQLALEEELPRSRQDSLATVAAKLADQVGDTSGTLHARLRAARHQVQASEHKQAQAQPLALLPAADTMPGLRRSCSLRSAATNGVPRTMPTPKHTG